MNFADYKKAVLDCVEVPAQSVLKSLGVNARMKELRKSTGLNYIAASAVVGVAPGSLRNQECGEAKLMFPVFMGCAKLFSKAGGFWVNALAVLYSCVDGSDVEDWTMSGLPQKAAKALQQTDAITEWLDTHRAEKGQRLRDLRGANSVNDWSKLTNITPKMIRQAETKTKDVSLILTLKYIVAASNDIDDAIINTKAILGV